MNIRDRRLKQKINEIIKRNLQNGYVPTSNEVISELSMFLSNNNLFLPEYKFVDRSRRISIDDINRDKKEIANDIDIVYQSMIELYQLVEEQIEKFAVERSKFDYQTSIIESDLLGLVNKYSVSGYIAGYREGFSDMQKVNTALTTAHVDISNHETSLKKLEDMPYTQYNIKVSSADGYISQNGDISEYLKTTGIPWQGIVERETQDRTTLAIDIDAGGPDIINRISLYLSMLKKCTYAVLTSMDGERWMEETRGVTIDSIGVGFASRPRYIKILLMKTEADKFILGKYLYYFIIDSIALSRINYSQQSILVSTPINIGSNINKVSLVEESILPQATTVDYFVAMNAEIPRWIQVSPTNSKNRQYPDVVSFNTVETNQHINIELGSEISNDAYELKDLTINGQRLFSISELSDVDINRHRLYKGINSWKQELLSLTALTPQTHAIFLENPQLITTSYIKMEEEKPGLILNGASFPANTVGRYSTTVLRESGDIIIKEIIASTHPVTIYLNGTILYSGTPTDGVVVTYPFKKGTNLIEVIISVSGMAPISCSLDTNLSLFSIGSMICANKNPMEAVSIFNLRYNTNNRYDVYSLHRAGDQYRIIVKDPDLTIRYDFVYDYVITPVKEILVKAVLSRDPNNVGITPKLKAYELRII